MWPGGEGSISPAFGPLGTKRKFSFAEIGRPCFYTYSRGRRVTYVWRLQGRRGFIRQIFRAPDTVRWEPPHTSNGKKEGVGRDGKELGHLLALGILVGSTFK